MITTQKTNNNTDGERDTNEESLAFSKRGSVTRSPTNSVTQVTKVKTATVALSTPVIPMKGPTFKGPTKGIDRDRDRVRTESMSSTGSNKRARHDASDEEDEGKRAQDVPDTVHEITGRLRKFCLSDGSKVNKYACETILGIASEYESLIVEIMLQNATLKGRLYEADRKPVQTFANVVKAQSVVVKPKASEVNTKAIKPKAKPKVLRPQDTHSIYIKDLGNKLSGDEVKDKVLKTVSNAVKSIRVKAVRRTKNGIFVETATREELNLLKSSGAIAEAGLIASDAEPSSAKLLIFEVPGDLSDKEILEDIFAKNLADKLNKDEFMSGATLSKGNSNKKACNRLLQCCLVAKKALLKEGRVYVGWQRLNLKLDVGIKRCLNCYGYSHYMRECKQPARLCKNCGEGGHLVAACKKTTPCCPNCKAAGLPDGHSALHKDCPIYKKTMSKMKKRSALDAVYITKEGGSN